MMQHVVLSSPMAVTFLKQSLIPPGTLFPQWVIDEINGAGSKSHALNVSGIIAANSQMPGDYGAVGRWVEQELANKGLPLNSGKGIDVPPYNIEIKTRAVQATSAHTFGKLTFGDIVRRPWKESDIAAKCQLHYRLMWDAEFMCVNRDFIIDFRQCEQQTVFEQAFNQARATLISHYQSQSPKSISILRRTPQINGLFLETDRKGNVDYSSLSAVVYQWRASDGFMKKWEVAGCKSTYHQLFE